MHPTPTLIIPGYQGSPKGHWQAWLAETLPHSSLLTSVNWHQPQLVHWVNTIAEQITQSPRPIRIVAHSFGVLAASVAIAAHSSKVESCFFVAPASPERFNLQGLKALASPSTHSIASLTPEHLKVNGLVIGSLNDPWLKATHAQAWAKRWGLDFECVGAAGHINCASGFGPWPYLLNG